MKGYQPKEKEVNVYQTIENLELEVMDIDMDELNAIQQQIKELGW